MFRSAQALQRQLHRRTLRDAGGVGELIWLWGSQGDALHVIFYCDALHVIFYCDYLDRMCFKSITN